MFKKIIGSKKGFEIAYYMQVFVFVFYGVLILNAIYNAVVYKTFEIITFLYLFIVIFSFLALKTMKKLHNAKEECISFYFKIIKKEDTCYITVCTELKYGVSKEELKKVYILALDKIIDELKCDISDIVPITEEEYILNFKDVSDDEIKTF